MKYFTPSGWRIYRLANQTTQYLSPSGKTMIVVRILNCSVKEN